MANSPRLAELADLITRREYNWTMVRARVHEEELVKRYASEHGLEYTTLADTIEDLYQKDVINGESRENLHALRILGNKAVHEGDSDPQDAKTAYEMLKQELAAYSDRKYNRSERTPVSIESSSREAQEDAPIRRRVRDNGSGTGQFDTGYVSGGRRSQGRPASGKNSSSPGIYSVLKILIPLLIIVLIVVLVKSIFSGNEAVQETTAAETETTIEETTEEPETEAPATTAPATEAPTTEAPVSWQVSADGVRFRLASDPEQIYTTAAKGTFIGQVTDYETENEKYKDFARFSYDGKDLVVSKQYIEKVAD